MDLPTSPSDAWSTGDFGDHTRAAPADSVMEQKRDEESDEEVPAVAQEKKECETDKLYVVCQR